MWSLSSSGAARLPGLVGPAGLSLVVGGVLYCQAHGALSGVTAPLGVSAVWSASGLLPQMIVLGAALRQAARLRAHPFAGGLFLLAAYAIALGTGGLLWEEVLLQPDAWTPALFRALPTAAGLTALTLASVLLRATEARNTAPAREHGLPFHAALIRSAGNYLSVEVEGREVLVRLPLHVAERRLATLGFVRAHRTALVNIARVTHAGRESGRLVLWLDDGRSVVVGRAYAAAVRSSLARCRSSQQD